MRKGGILVVLLLSGLVGSRDARAFCNGWLLHCYGEGHDSITEDGLDDLVDDTVVGWVVSANTGQDDVDYANPGDDWTQHSTSCWMEQTSLYVNDQYALAAQALAGNDPDPATAAVAWGRVLHAVQDFYAHSNYVELLGDDGDHDIDGDEILFSEGGPFPPMSPLAPIRPGSDIVFAQTTPTVPTARSSLAEDSAIPVVTTPSGTFRGLTTGWNEGGSCFDARSPRFVDDAWAVDGPREHNLVHGGGGDDARPCSRAVVDTLGVVHYEQFPTSICLNKDDDDRPGHEAAYTLAAAQTRQEWCRLLDSAAAGPGRGRAVNAAVGYFGRDHADLQPAGTSCAPVAPGPVLVQVTLRQTNVAAPADPVRYGFTVVTEDLGAIERVGFVAPPGERHPLTSTTVSVCVDPQELVTVGLWGWQDGGFVEWPLGGASQSFLPVSTVASVSSGPGFGFEVELVVEPDADDIDSDGLSSCGEARFGTDPGDAYTDDDPWPDGYEVHVLGTDPRLVDTDGDYLWDAEKTWFGTDPTDPDTDGDGVLDGVEVWEGTDPLAWEIHGELELPCALDRDKGCLDSDKDGVDDARDPSTLAMALKQDHDAFDEVAVRVVDAWLDGGPERIEELVRNDSPGAAALELSPLFDALGAGCIVREKELPKTVDTCLALVRLSEALQGR